MLIWWFWALTRFRKREIWPTGAGRAGLLPAWEAEWTWPWDADS